MKFGCHRVAGLHVVEIHPNFVILLVDKFSLNGGAVARGPLRVMRDGLRALEKTRSLLHYMRQLMRKKATAGLSLWRIFVGAEHDVAASRKGARADRGRGIGRPRIYMHAHPAEVMSEARLQERACSCVQGLTG